MCLYEEVPRSGINEIVHPSRHIILTPVSRNARCKLASKAEGTVAATKGVSVTLWLPFGCRGLG